MPYLVIYIVIGFLIMYFNAFKHAAFWRLMNDEMDERLTNKSETEKQFKNHFLAGVYIIMMFIWPYVLLQLFVVHHKE